VFDIFGLEYGLPFMTGSKVYISSVRYVEKYKLDDVDIIQQTPSSFDLIAPVCKDYYSSAICLVGGEPLNKKIFKLLKNSFNRIINAYGPAETTVWSSYGETSVDDINIGVPISNERVYVLDSRKKPTSIGVIGELYIGGAGLARGYLNRPELTLERFVSNPFATEDDIAKGYTRLYKTGDLVRWLEDGNIEYIGRNDDQVKIRGYRIELGEIENQLSAISGVKQSYVLVKDRNNTKYLVGYYVSDVDSITQEEILNQLSKVLPEYMVPSVLVEIDSMPLTVNGKLDRKALPDPEFIDEESFIAPTTEFETTLCNIFAEVLGLERVGVTDDFFRIGGDSIVSIQLSSRLRHNRIDCSVRDIFDYRTVSKLANYLLSKEETEATIIKEEGILEGELGLLPIQDWFFKKVNDGAFKSYNHWNQSFLVKVLELDITKIDFIADRLVSHHDILRVNYIKQEDGSYTQVYRSSIDIPKLRILDVSSLTQEEIENELTTWQSGFDIENGPLWSIGYLHGYKDGSSRLYFALHHLIIDAVSWRILIEDFRSLYNEEELLTKGTSYRQYVSLVKEYSTKNKDQLGYWRDILSNIPSYPEISSKPSLGEVRLDRFQTESLLQRGNKAYHTEINDLLLVALAYSLREINQSDVQGVTLEGHGREYVEDGIDLNSTVGWFTTMYPTLLEVKEGLDSTIKYVKESIRAIPDKGIGFGSFVQAQEFGFDQLPRISFNYLGQFDSQEGLWQLASQSSGVSMHPNNQDHNIININGMVIEGELRFSVVTQLGQETTNKLSQSFQANLIKVQEHTQQLLEEGKEYYTPSDYGSNISIDLFERLQEQARELGNDIEAIYLANSLQQGFIYHVLSNPEDDAYRVQILFDYKQELDVDRYIKSWELSIEKYPILRTMFNWDDELIQVALKRGKLNYTYHDISDYEDKDAQIKIIQEQDRTQGFDLSKPTQLRLHIIRQSQEHYTILKSEHHVISDGWSGPILLNQVHEYYKEYQKVII
jgi:non-ribosomal peptide synthase protein (TIGR01720 family)